MESVINKPLKGKLIVITRPKEQAFEFASLLEKEGANILLFPTIKIVPPEDFSLMDKAIQSLDSFDLIIFTSVNGVRFFVERVIYHNKSLKSLKSKKICVIGPRSKIEVEKYNLNVDILPEEYRAEGIIEYLKKKDIIRGKNILIPRASKAREILQYELSKEGANVTLVPAYNTIKSDEGLFEFTSSLKNGKIDLITFTSSSCVTNFVAIMKEQNLFNLITKIPLASIGPITSETLGKYGLKATIEPSKYTIYDLSQEIISYISRIK